VIEGATVIDGTGKAAISDAAIVIEGNKIQSIGPRASVQRPAGARVINAQGKFIVPGLWDAHTHWRGWTGELFLAHGVTTILDLGTTTDWILAARGAEDAGRMRSPRIFTSGNVLDRRRETEGGFGGGVHSSFHMDYVTSPQNARAQVRRELEKGVDVVKVYQDMTLEELETITKEAHRVDIAVVGHSNNLYDSVKRGLDGVTHLWGVGLTLMPPDKLKEYEQRKVACPYAWMDVSKMDDLVSFLVQHGTYINPALINEHAAVLKQTKQWELDDYQLLMDPNLRYVPLDAVLSSLTFFHKLRSYSASLGPFPYVENVPPAVIEEYRRGYRNSQEFVGRFARAGGKLFAGSDAAGSASLPGASLLQELELLVEAGATPMQAIQSATYWPAEMIHLDYKLGTLQAGRLADLLILNGDPLADIRNLRKIETVMKDGKIVDTKYHREYQPAFSELEGVGASSSTPGTPHISEVQSITMNQWSMVIRNASPFELVVKGSGFHSTSLVYLRGKPLRTRFINSRELRAQVPVNGITDAGMFPVTVVTPWPGGGSSNVVGLSVK
jgi:hypothetical protein